MGTAKAPTVSIILPVFNRLKYLRRAVDSVFAQSFADWELIVADDGSDENTRAFLGAIALVPRVRVLWLAHRGTPAPVRNAALHEARGEYVAFLDSDDLWAPAKLEAQIGSLRARSTRQWAYTGFTIIDGAGEPRREARWHWPTPDGWIFEPLLRMEAIVATSTVVVRRSLLEELGGFDESLAACEDYDLWLRCACRSEVDVVAEPLVRKRQHGEHYADDVMALEGWRSVLEKAGENGLDPRLRPVVQRERSRVSSKLAIRHAICGNSGNLWQTLLQSWPYSWRYRQWWLEAIAATTRLYTPAFVRRAVRGHRVRASTPTSTQP
jgi:glycosyltransferase involved in cell wall biosynthesis